MNCRNSNSDRDLNHGPISFLEHTWQNHPGQKNHSTRAYKDTNNQPCAVVRDTCVAGIGRIIENLKTRSLHAFVTRRCGF